MREGQAGCVGWQRHAKIMAKEANIALWNLPNGFSKYRKVYTICYSTLTDTIASIELVFIFSSNDINTTHRSVLSILLSLPFQLFIRILVAQCMKITLYF